MPPEHHPQDRIDGRTARRDRNRAAVLDAVIDLFAEGNLTPGVHEVAERSGVSLRSVYRYFDDVDDLIAAAIDRGIEAAAHLFEATEGADAPLTHRIRAFCERRVALFVEVRTVYRAGVIRSADQPRLRSRVQSSREELGLQTAKTFAADLADLPSHERDVVCEMLDALSQFDTLDRLMGERGRDRADAVAFLCEAFARVLCGDREAVTAGV
jgi:AcrR family transcriptional regulator